MHTFTDPADGETYVSAYVGMDIAQRVFPCFDQNDLKAPLTLHVTAPEGWTVLANGRLADARGRPWRFATTPPIPTAMFVVCAGPWHSLTWEHEPDGGPCGFGWHARASLAAELDRDAEELKQHHRAPTSTTTRSSSTSPIPSTPTTRRWCPGRTGAPWRPRAASPTATSTSRSAG